MQRILRSRLPERLSGQLPPLLVEVGVGLFFTAVMTLLRYALVLWTGDRAPYAFVFIAVASATVVAGWRSGLLALVLGQTLAWYLFIDPANYAAQTTQYVSGLVVAGLAELVVLTAIALYQREIDAAWSKRQSEMDMLQQALREIDHRTTNNYQTVLALILAQSKRAGDGEVKRALQQVADRIAAVSQASRSLAMSSESLKEVRLADHLRELTAQIERGLSRPGIRLHAEFADVAMPPNQAVFVSILVNEFVTNALKHAFPDDSEGTIRIILERQDDEISLLVEDDGAGISKAAGSRGTGLGRQLIATFTKQLQARHEVVSDARGTSHRVRIALPS